MQSRAKVATVPITAIGNELKALKLKIVRRTENPDDVLRSVPAYLHQHASSLAASNINTEPSQLRDIGEFAVNFSYLMTRVCEMPTNSFRGDVVYSFPVTLNSKSGGLSSSSSPSSATTAIDGEPASDFNREWEALRESQGNDALNYIDPTTTDFSSASSSTGSGLQKNVGSSSASPFNKRRLRNNSTPTLLLSPQICHGILLLMQQYVSHAHLHDNHVKLQHINGVLKTALLLHSHLSYAFFNQLDSESVVEMIEASHAMLLSFIRRNKFAKTRVAKSVGGRSGENLLVPSNALINAIELCCEKSNLISAKNESRRSSDLFGFSGSSLKGMKGLLPIKSVEDMSQKMNVYSPETIELMGILLEMSEMVPSSSSSGDASSIFNTMDASTILSIFGKVGIKNDALVDRSLQEINASNVAPHAAASVLFSCGTIGLTSADHPLIPRISQKLASLERPDAKLLRSISLAGAMLNGFEPRISNVTPKVMETWWKRLACKQPSSSSSSNNNVPFHAMVDIGFAMRSMGIVSPKANYMISKGILISDKYLTRKLMGGAGEDSNTASARTSSSLLASEPLPTLLKAMYLLGDTTVKRGDEKWAQLIEKTTLRVASAAATQIEHDSILLNDAVIGGLAVDGSGGGVMGFVSQPKTNEEARHRAKMREREEDALLAHMKAAMLHCHLKKDQLIISTKKHPSAPTAATAAAVTPAPQTVTPVAPTAPIVETSPDTSSTVTATTTSEDIEEAIDEKDAEALLTEVSDILSAPVLTVTEEEKIVNEGKAMAEAAAAEAAKEQYTPNPVIVTLGWVPPLPETPVDPHGQMLVSTQWSVLLRHEVVENLSAIDSTRLDHHHIFALFERIADNVDGDINTQREVNNAMGPLFNALKQKCEEQLANKTGADASSSSITAAFSAAQLFNILSFLDIVGEPAVSVAESCPAVLAALAALTARTGELTRTQAGELVGVLESFIPLYEEHGEAEKVMAAGEALEEAIRRRFRNL